MKVREGVGVGVGVGAGITFFFIILEECWCLGKIELRKENKKNWWLIITLLLSGSV